MNLTTETFGGGRPTPRRVRVPGRDDLGEVISAGKNVGQQKNLYCVEVYMPDTGEVLTFESGRLEYVDEYVEE